MLKIPPIERFTLASLCLFLAASAASAQTLIHRYQFDGDVADSVSSIDGTASTDTLDLEAPNFGAITPTGASGPTQSIEFGMSDGTKKSFFTTPGTLIQNLAAAGSISAFVRTDATTSSAFRYTIAGLPAGGGFNFGQVASAGDQVLRMTVNNVALGESALVPGRWYHIGLTWEQSGTDLIRTYYVDGSQVATETTPGSITGITTFRVGTFNPADNNTNLANQFDGRVYDLQIYQGVLSPEQISQLHSNPGTAILEPEPWTYAAFAWIEFWYQDTNLRTAGGIPGDLAGRYEAENLDNWATSRELMDVYYLRQNTFRQHLQGDADLQQKMAAAHNAHGTTLAYDCVDATWAHNRSGGATPDFNQTINELNELVENGFVLSHIGLQSILSKPLRDSGGNEIPYGLDLRIQDVVEFIKQVRPQFPGVKIGIIDAMAAQGKPWESWFTQLRDAVEAAGRRLDFIHVDMPFSYPRNGINGNSWARLVAHEQFIRDTIGAEAGIIATDNVGGMISSNQWRADILDGIENYLAAGGQPDALMLFSWFDYPTETIPDALTPMPSGSATQLRVFREMVAATLSFSNSRFGDWIAGFSLGAQDEPNDDPEGDDLDNAIENFFGTHPNEFSRGLIVVEAGSGTLTFTHPQNPTPADDLRASYPWSTDLINWHHNGVTNSLGTKVKFSTRADTPVIGQTEVKAHITGTPADTLFIRVAAKVLVP